MIRSSVTSVLNDVATRPSRDDHYEKLSLEEAGVHQPPQQGASAQPKCQGGPPAGRARRADVRSIEEQHIRKGSTIVHRCDFRHRCRRAIFGIGADERQRISYDRPHIRHFSFPLEGRPLRKLGYRAPQWCCSRAVRGHSAITAVSVPSARTVRRCSDCSIRHALSAVLERY